MNRPTLAILLAGGLVLGSGPDLLAHGGQYRPPGDSVPPNSGPGPGTPGPGPGPTTGGPGPGPVTPPGGRPPVTPGGGVPTGGGAPSGGPKTGIGRKRHGGEDTSQWHFWWEVNKDPYLQLKSGLGAGATVTGVGGLLGGVGRSEAIGPTRGVTTADLMDQIIPALREALRADDADVLDSATLALARIAPPLATASVLEDLKGMLRSKYDSVQQSAVVGLGVLGDRAAVPMLVSIARDTPEGRVLLGNRGVTDQFLRGFACVALGMLGDPSSTSTLIELAKRTSNADRDLRSSAIMALGLCPSDREVIVLALAELLRDARMDDTIRAQIPIALARLGDAAAPTLPELTRIAQDSKADNAMRQSAIIAIGCLAHPEDEDAVRVLRSVVGGGYEPHARHFAIMALARVGARAAREDRAEVLDEIGRFLLGEMTRPSKSTHRPWAAQALGVVGHDLPPNAEERVLWSTKIDEVSDDVHDPQANGAFAIALGLLDARPYSMKILKKLRDGNGPVLERGYYAVALGMLRETAALDDLRKSVVSEPDGFGRLQFATALGLLGDAEAMPRLVAALGQAKSLSETVSLARAIGLIGDRSAMPALIELARNAKAPGLARGFGCVALGLLGERGELYWNTPISVNANYRLALWNQQELLDIL